MRRLALALSGLLIFSCAGGSGEEVTFESDQFTVVGELTLPSGDAPHPAIILVHGDGPAFRRMYNAIRERISRAGYATFVYDKPGYGDSRPAFDRATLFEQRAQVLLDALATLKAHPAIDPRRVGLWGISQAGYVMPLAVSRDPDVAFMIAASNPGANSIDQSAFLLESQCLCEGQSLEEAEAVKAHFVGLFNAQSYEEYLTHAEPLVANPVVADVGFVTAVRPEHDWEAYDPEGKAFFDPITLVERITIPVLAFFGAKDTQIDPFQGAEAYRAALERAGNRDFRVVLIPGVDHGLITSETGCLNEQATRSPREWRNYAPQYLDTLEDWLVELTLRERD
ncbi:MAG: alpha/beta fold hydrolase [Gemmatimonadota bacterium]|nr:MAG: alpha/beta fold hydrolase [Gemmatimonadota bacterium]